MRDNRPPRTLGEMSPLRAAVLYLLLGGAWILASDALLLGLFDAEEALRYQTLKGWFYVGVTALIAYAIVRRLRLSEQARRAGQAEVDAFSRIAAVAFETHEGMFITDAERRILRVNDAFTAMTGYSQGEVLGRHPDMLVPRSAAAPSEAVTAALDAEGHWEGEVVKHTRDGRTLPVWERIIAVRGRDGAVSHHVTTLFDLRERKDAQRAIDRLSHFDALTALPNRQTLLRMLEIESARLRDGACSALLFIDIDNFKQVNEAAGYSSGDALLVAIAHRLSLLLDGEDVLARHAADEFLLLYACRLPDAEATAAASARRAEHVLHALQQPFDVDGQEFLLSGCIGICLIDGQEASVETLLRAADTARHQAKRDGSTAVRFFEPSMQSHAESAFRIVAELRHSLESGDFELHYQRKVDLAGHSIGAEALLRWSRADGESVSPAVFVPIAEQAGLIAALGGWVLRKACHDLAALAASGTVLPLSVNVSAAQVRQPDFVDSILDALQASGASAEHLTLEITESLAMEDIGVAIERLGALRAHGVRISMDDFGTGYSSLAYLKRLPLDEIKIDRSFVRDAEQEPGDRALVEAIASVGQALGLAVIAEGVETEAQAEFLRQAGCSGMQGFLFGRPMPLADLRRTLEPLATAT
jgi:diguanylate cyclase (GGDEF)-like protein/PAS domain S-box-containing protein